MFISSYLKREKSLVKASLFLEHKPSNDWKVKIQLKIIDYLALNN